MSDDLGLTAQYMTVEQITNSHSKDDITERLVQITGIPAGTSLNVGAGFHGYVPDKENPQLL